LKRVVSFRTFGALPAFALVENTAFVTAFSNDCDPEYVFAQQVYAYAEKGDCVLGISTSGNSKNVIYGLSAAKGRRASTIGLIGGTGGKMKDICDHLIVVPENETYKVQELHLLVYHTLCLMLEQYFWGE
jgi:D-sedoheptulose 7-phosphate isomerase